MLEESLSMYWLDKFKGAGVLIEGKGSALPNPFFKKINNCSSYFHYVMHICTKMGINIIRYDKKECGYLVANNRSCHCCKPILQI